MQRFFTHTDLAHRHTDTNRRYLEFLRIPTMSAGLYVLPAGATDDQRPHPEDEVYYILSGRGRFGVTTPEGEQDREVGPGDMILVLAHENHRFHGITEELALLVVFAPAEAP